MATDYAIEVLIDNTATADKKTEIVQRVFQALLAHTRTTTYATTYAAGTTSVNAITLTVGGTGTVGIGIRLTLDKTAFGVDVVPEVVRKIIQSLESEALTIAHGANEYTAGNRTYNVTIALT